MLPHFTLMCKHYSVSDFSFTQFFDSFVHLAKFECFGQGKNIMSSCKVEHCGNVCRTFQWIDLKKQFDKA